MRPATKHLIAYGTAWALIATAAVILSLGLFGCAATPHQEQAATPTTTATQPAPILTGTPSAGTTASEWLMWLCGLAVPAGVALMLYPPLAPVGMPVAAGGAAGTLWNLGIIQHGALIGWIAAGVIVAALIIIAIIAIRRYRALAVASMQGIEAHKAQLDSIPVDPNRPHDGTLWDRLTATLAAQYKTAGVDSAAKDALVTLGFSRAKS